MLQMSKEFLHGWFERGCRFADACVANVVQCVLPMLCRSADPPRVKKDDDDGWRVKMREVDQLFCRRVNIHGYVEMCARNKLFRQNIFDATHAHLVAQCALVYRSACNSS